MNRKAESRLYVLALAGLFATAVGELLAVPLLAAVGVAGVFLTVVAAFAVATGALAAGLVRAPDIEMRDSPAADRSR